MEEVTTKMDQGTLIYNSFTIVYFHLFQLEKGTEIVKDLKTSENDIDSKIFFSIENSQLIKRYDLKSFDIEIKLYDTDNSPVIYGKVRIEASLFYNSTFSLSYRLMVGPNANCTTDDMITLAGIILGNEHWNSSTNENSESIDTEVGYIKVENLYIDSNGKSLNKEHLIEGKKDIFREVLTRHKCFITEKVKCDLTNDLFYVMADVWEDIEHFGNPKFVKLSEPEIISHILENHKSELMGLFTLYPSEWIYRNPEFFDEICGGNIAIDTDDLVLCNENICVVFGTYGRRGGDEAETDWKNILKSREKYHVSWPEYLAILELLLVRKHIISTLHSIIGKLEPQKVSNLETIAKQSFDINNALLRMDALKFSKYSSHRHMYRKTEERLRIKQENEELNTTSEFMENQINYLKSLKEKKTSAKLTVLLAMISGVSILQIFLYDVKVPYITIISDKSDPIGSIIKSISNNTDPEIRFGAYINIIALILVLLGFTWIIISIAKFLMKFASTTFLRISRKNEIHCTKDNRR